MELHFRVDAASIVDAGRSLWQEKSYSRSLSLFIDGFQMTLDEAFEVLSGTKTLQSNDGESFLLVEDNWTQPTGYLKPCMEVVFSQMREWENVRDDWAKLKNISVLAWSAKGIPVKSGRSGSGYTRSSPIGYVKESYVIDLITGVFEEPTQDEFTTFWNEHRDYLVEELGVELPRIPELNPLPERVTVETVEPPPEPDDNLDAKNGFILRDGKFYSCKYSEHNDLADRLLNHLGIEYGHDPGKEAENQGWAKCFHGLIKGVLLTKKPTKKQRDTIMSWCSNHKVNLPY